MATRREKNRPPGEGQRGRKEKRTTHVGGGQKSCLAPGCLGGGNRVPNKTSLQGKGRSLVTIVRKRGDTPGVR